MTGNGKKEQDKELNARKLKKKTGNGWQLQERENNVSNINYEYDRWQEKA